MIASFKQWTRRALRGALPALAMAGAAAPHAHAGSLPPNYDSSFLWNGFWFGVGDPSFTLKLAGIVDLDQKRNHLVGNGSLYCVPTSTLDQMYWLAKHGEPKAAQVMDPIFQFVIPLLQPMWGGSGSDYNRDQVLGDTMRDLVMGASMDAEDGTNESDALDGEAEWLTDRGIFDFFQISSWHDDDGFNPGLAAEMLDIGAQGKLRIGWMKGADHDDEDGRHMRWLNGVKLEKSPSWADDGKWHYVYYYSDPGTDEGAGVANKLNTQSTYKRDLAGLRWNSELDQWCFGKEPSASKKWGCLNGILYLAPLSFITGFGGENVGEAQQGLSGADYVKPSFNVEEGFGKTETHALKVPGGIRAVTYDVLPTRAFAIGREGDTVYRIDLASETVSATTKVRGARAIVTGGADGALFVLGDDGLTRLERRRGERGEEISVAGSVKVDRDAVALGYDPIADRVLVVSERTLTFYSPILEPTLSLATPIVSGKGSLVSAIDGATGDVWLGRGGASQLLRVEAPRSRDARAEAVKLEGVKALVTFVIDPNGRVAVNDGGRLRTFQADGRVLEAETRLGDSAVGSVLAFPLARRVTWHDDPRLDASTWTLPEEIYGDDAEVSDEP